MPATSGYVITSALRLFGIIDQSDTAQPADLANGVPILNDLLRNEHADGAAQYLMNLATTVLPIGTINNVYSFQVGVEQTSYLVQVDAVAIKAIWMNDISPTVNRETRMAPKADVVRTTYPGIVTKWHQERQIDGSVRVYAWQPPRSAANALIEYGGRIGLLSDPLGGDVIGMPPEGIHDITLLYGRRVMSAYGRSPQAAGVIVQDADAVDKRWRSWAKGQQWLRLVRA